MFNRLSHFTIALIIGIFGFYCIVGFAPLNPTNISWLRLGDSIYPYFGWAFFSNYPWTFPLGLNPAYGLDISSSIVYSDSIPLLAIPFKAIVHLLPNPFQYFGLWLLICFILQAWLSIKIISLFTNDRIVVFLSSFLFIFFPPLIWRILIPELGTQAPVSSQFFILAALYLNLRHDQSYREYFWPILLTCASLVNFYFFAMCSLLWGASLLDQIFRKKIVSTKSILIEPILCISLVLLASWQSGYYSVKSDSLTTGEYGACGMNVFSFVSPNNGASYLLPHIPGTVRCYEDSNFVGMGILILFIASIFQIYVKKIAILPTLKKYTFLFVAIIFLALFSFSNKVGIATLTYSFSPPDLIIYIGGVLRQAGRMFWPFLYLAIVFSIFILCKSICLKKLRALIFVIVAIQITDTSSRWLNVRSEFSQNSIKESVFDTNIQSLSDPFWNDAGKHYKNLVQMPVTQEPDGGNAQNRNLSYAMKFNMGTNAAFQARVDINRLKKARERQTVELMSGKYNAESLYILSDEKLIPALLHLNHNEDVLARINGINLIAPGWKKCKTCPPISEAFIISDNILSTSINSFLDFSSTGNARQYLVGIGYWPQVGWGWSFPEAFGVWSEGYQAKLVIPLPMENEKTVELEMRALVTASHPKQEVSVWVNSEFQKRVVLTKDQGNTILIDIPNTSPKQDYITIELRLHTKVRPKDLGLGDDVRELAIGLVSGVIR